MKPRKTFLKIKAILLFLLLGQVVWSPGAQARLFFTLEQDGTPADSFMVDSDQSAPSFIDLTFGGLARFLRWDIPGGRFILNDTLRVVGNLAAIGQAYIADDHNAIASDGVLNLGREASVWKRLKFNGLVGGRFELNDDLDIAGKLLVNQIILNGVPLQPPGGSPIERNITLVPEYPGAVFRGNGGRDYFRRNGDRDHKGKEGNSGKNFGSAFCANGVGDILDINTDVCTILGDIHNYYEWEPRKKELQNYGIWLRWMVPMSFNSWELDPIKIYGKKSDTNGGVRVFVYDTNGVLENPGGTQVAQTTWTQTSIEPTFGGTYAPGSYMTLNIQLAAEKKKPVQVGEILLSYNF